MIRLLLIRLALTAMALTPASSRAGQTSALPGARESGGRDPLLLVAIQPQGQRSLAVPQEITSRPRPSSTDDKARDRLWRWLLQAASSRLVEGGGSLVPMIPRATYLQEGPLELRASPPALPEAPCPWELHGEVNEHNTVLTAGIALVGAGGLSALLAWLAGDTQPIAASMALAPNALALSLGGSF